jgi:hypothetical protein
MKSRAVNIESRLLDILNKGQGLTIQDRTVGVAGLFTSIM